MPLQPRVTLTQRPPAAEIIGPWAVLILSVGYIITYAVRGEWLQLGTMGFFFAVCIGASVIELRGQRRR